MTKIFIGLLVIIAIVGFTLYSLVKIGCEGPPKPIVISTERCQPLKQTQQVVEIRYKLVNVWPATQLLIGASVPLSLIAIGTSLMIRALWKAKWQ